MAHGLPMLPLLGMLPYNFLPAGVVLFIPALCILTALSACAHIVIVYLAWYLKVGTFEEVFSSVVGGWGLHAGRAAVVVSSVGVLVSWVESESHRRVKLISSLSSLARTCGRDVPSSGGMARSNHLDNRSRSASEYMTRSVLI